MSDLLGVIPWLLGTMAVATVAGRSMGGTAGKLLPVAVVARFLGSIARYEVIERAYAGVADAKRYFAYGVVHAAELRNGNLSFLLPDEEARWWGTRFVENVSAFVVLFTGDNIRSGFFVFSLFGLTGSILLVQAFRQSGLREHETLYAPLALLWPSISFWPSSMGKDALMIMGVGAVVLGYVGRSSRPAILPLAAGFLLLVCIRPHIAAIATSSLICAEVLSSRRTATASVRTLVLLGLAGGGAVVALSQFSLELTDVEGIQETFEVMSSRTAQGGSAIAVSTGISSLPMAMVNSLMRPFPWEAHNVPALFASIEIWGLWIYVAFNRRHIAQALARLRDNRVIRVGLILAVLLSLFYGLAISNMGIIARQRVVILPLLFLLVGVRQEGDLSPPERGFRNHAGATSDA